jgi:Asp-tRNA(Asn)/Glu-tRNA(Gln) amidotransferase A subunit family amidase
MSWFNLIKGQEEATDWFIENWIKKILVFNMTHGLHGHKALYETLNVPVYDREQMVKEAIDTVIDMKLEGGVDNALSDAEPALLKEMEEAGHAIHEVDFHRAYDVYKDEMYEVIENFDWS